MRTAPRMPLDRDMVILQDLRYALRLYTRQPGLPAAATLILALGIGVNLAVLMLINTVLLRPMPQVRDADRLALIGRTRPHLAFENLSYPDYADVRDQARSFQHVAAYRMMRYAFRAGGQTDRLGGEAATPNYLDALHVRLAFGRWFRQNDTTALVISDRLWQERWRRNPNVLGQSVTVNGVGHTIVGVTEPGFRGSGLTGNADLWTPLAGLDELDRTFKHLPHRDSTWLHVFGRLRDGVTPARADAELASLALALRDKHARDFAQMSLRTARYNALHQAFAWDSLTVFLALLAGLTFITVIVVCANVANLLLARMTARRREIAIRLSIGAGRWRVVRQFLVEGLVLGCCGVLGGMLVGSWAAEWLASHVPSDDGAPVVLALAWDSTLFAYAAALALVSTLAMALPAAWQSSHAGVLADLKAGEAATGRTRLRTMLAVAQVALCVVLVAAASLAARSVRDLRQVARNVPASRLVIASLDLGLNGYQQPQGKAFLATLQERLAALPGVESVALAKMTAFSGSSMSLLAHWGGVVPKDRAINAATNIQSPGYFATLGLPLLAGRDFTVHEPRRAVVLNEIMARRLFPDRAAVGQLIRADHKKYPDFEVIGVVRDQALDIDRAEAQPRLYYHLAQFDNWNLAQTVHLRTAADPAALHSAIRQTVATLDPHVPVFAQGTLAGVMEEGLYTPKMLQAVAGYSSLMGIVVAAIGLYGLLAFRVAQRTREIGVRIALGATPGDILRRVLSDGLAIGVSGIALGLLLSFGLTQVLVGVLYGVQPLEPLALTGSAAILLTATLVACGLPAWRAVRIAPGVALRHE